MNIKVLGWYNHGNVGDEAYKVAFPFLFPQHDIQFISSVEQNEAADVLILGGGDVCYHGFTNQINQSSAFNRKVAFSVSITVNSDFSTLKNFDAVYVRDKRSYNIAKNELKNVFYLPDATFVLNPNPQKGREWIERQFEHQQHKLYEKVVVCVISNYLTYNKLDKYARDLTTFLYVSQKLAETADLTNASFIFLPFSTKAPWDDRVSNSWVADRCKHYDKNLMVYESLDVQTTLDIIAAANVCVSSRLHSTIFSTICGTPFVDITHHTKNLGFLETVNKTKWSLPYWDFNSLAYGKILNNLLSKQGKNSSLINFSQSAKEQISAEAISLFR